MNDTSNLLIPIFLPIVLFLFIWLLLNFAFPRLWHGMKLGAQRASVLVLRSSLKQWSDERPHLSNFFLHLPIFLIIVVGGIAAFAAGKVFGDLGDSFRLESSSVYNIDHSVHSWFQSERVEGLTFMFTMVTQVGGVAGLAVISILMSILLVRKQRASAVYLLLTSIGGALLNVGLKLLYVRARPDFETAVYVAQGHSFPSGHAMCSFIILGAIAYLLLRQNYEWKIKSILLAVIVTLIVLVGVSRVYLGVHWSSDIIAGWCAGGVWLIAATVAFETHLRVRQIERGNATMAVGTDIPDKPIPSLEAAQGNISTQAKKIQKNGK